MSVVEVLPHIVTAYAMAVVDGHILTGRFVRLACERHLHDLERAKKRNAPIWFDEAEASKAIRFFQTLRQSKGKWAGKRLHLRPWACFVIGSVYGWKKVPVLADGQTPDWSRPHEKWPRRFRTVYEELARKNGKSTKAAAVGLKGLAADGEGGPEVYAAATKRDQAKIVWSEAMRMAKQTASLRRRMNIQKHRLEYRRNDGFFVALASDSDTADGLNPSTVIVDEFHAHKNRGLFDLLETALGAREQPLVFIITTAGEGGVESACRETRDYAVEILEGFRKRGGRKDDSFFAYIATIDEGDDWKDPAVWPKANPNLGISPTMQFLLGELKRAIAIPAQAIRFQRLYLNIWTSAESVWLDMEKWATCGGRFDPDLLLGRDCHAGLDLSKRFDLTAYALLFPPIETDPLWRVLVRQFMPEANIEEREKADKTPYRKWAKAGHLELIGGDIVDQDHVRMRFNEDAAKFNILSVGFDSWNATQFEIDLERDGFDVYELRFGMQTMSKPTKFLEELVISRKLAHGSNPLLDWQAKNTMVRFDSNMNYMPAKAKSRVRIDGMTAVTVAAARATALDGGPSVYEDRGLRTA